MWPAALQRKFCRNLRGQICRDQRGRRAYQRNRRRSPTRSCFEIEPSEPEHKHLNKETTVSEETVVFVYSFQDVRFFPGIGHPAILPDGSARIKKAEPEMGTAFCFVLSVLFIFFRRTRLLRHRLKRGSFVPMLNGNHSILR